MSNIPSERVLVVDDNDSEISALRAIIEPLHVGLTGAGSLDELRQALARGNIAVALIATDAQSVSPVEATRLISGARIPIVVLAESRESVAALAQDSALEAVDLALRPLDPVLLHARARAYLEMHRCSAEVTRLSEQLAAAHNRCKIIETRAAFFEQLIDTQARTQSLESVLQAALPLLGDAAMLTLLENDGIQKWQVESGPNHFKLDDWRVELIPAETIRTGKTVTLLDGAVTGVQNADLNAKVLRELGVGACLCLPLNVNGRVLGAVTFLKGANDGLYSSRDLALAEQLCQKLASTLQSAHQNNAVNRERAELEASGRAKDAFLATLSHELRAPLNAIVGWAKMLATGEVAQDKQAHAVETIDRNARALASLVADLIDRSSATAWPSATSTSPDRPDTVSELLSGLYALVVEDDPDSSELVETILRRFGADVTCVATVRAALGALAARKPDVLVSDIGLPDDDGLTLIRRIREMGELAALPAIALSAYASRRDISQALAAGFQAYIPKPIEPDQLGRIIADVVNG